MRQRLRTVFTIDLRSIALFRIGLALCLLLDLLLRSSDLRAFYTDDGILNRTDWLSIVPKFHWSLHAASGDLWFQTLLFLCSTIFALCLLFGYRTRLMTFLCWVMTVSLLNRNTYIAQAGDELLVILLFWAMFLPLHARYSVDAALSNIRKHNLNTENITSNRYFSVATIAIILQILYLYIFTALLKTGEPWRTTMDAAYYALSLQDYATPLGTWLRDITPITTFGTWYVLLVELFAPILILNPFWQPQMRLFGLFFLLSLHVAFGLFLHIGLFPLFDFVALSILIPGTIWSRLGKSQLRQQRQLTQIYFDEDCGFCRKMCLLLREFLLPSKANILPAQQDQKIYPIMQKHDSWVIKDAQGNIKTRWQAMHFLFQQSPVFKPIAWIMQIPFLMALGDRLYSHVADNRNHFSVFCEQFLPYRKFNLYQWPIAGFVAAFFLYVVTVVNFYGLEGSKLKKPSYIATAEKIVRLDQKWGMFAPSPFPYSLYPVIEGELRNGDKVDLFRQSHAAPIKTVPERFYSEFKGYRWRKLFSRIYGLENNTIRNSYGTYLCQQWNNSKRPFQMQLGIIKVNFIRLMTKPNNQAKEESFVTSWTHWCFAEFKPSKSE